MQCSFEFVIEQRNQMQICQVAKFANGLVHEHAAAVNGRTNRIGRNKKNAQLRGLHGQIFKTVAEVAAQWTPEGFRVGVDGEFACPYAACERIRKL